MPTPRQRPAMVSLPQLRLEDALAGFREVTQWMLWTLALSTGDSIVIPRSHLETWSTRLIDDLKQFPRQEIDA